MSKRHARRNPNVRIKQPPKKQANPEIRLRARALFRKNYAKLLLPALLSVLMSFLPEKIAKSVAEQIWAQLALQIGIYILLAPICHYGATRICLCVWRDEPAPVRAGFLHGVSRSAILRSAGIAAVLSMPLFVPLTLSSWLASLLPVRFAGVASSVRLILVLATACLSIRLGASYVAAAREPEAESVRTSISLSWRATRGNSFWRIPGMGICTGWPIWVCSVCALLVCVVVDAVVFRKKVLTGLFSPILLTGYVFYGGYVRLCQVALHDVLIADLSQA